MTGTADGSPPDRATLDLVPEAVVVLDRDARIAAVNDRAGPLLGLTAAAIGVQITDALAVHDASGTRCGALVPAGRVDRLAERVVHVGVDEGERRPVAMSGRRHPQGWVLTFRNASRRERNDAARADVVATVSHEIRSPLTSVKGFTKTLLNRWDRFTDEQKRNMLETINEDADRVTRLLTELLDVSRIDAGRVQLHRQMVDLGILVQRVADGALARHEGRVVAVEIVGSPTAYADPDKLTQVVNNLVENALRHADSDVHIHVVRDGDDARISVVDEGAGIAVDQQRRIFEKFGRGRGSRRAGTGLGLFIVRGLARAHGGECWVVSAPGAGAAFHVRLPARSPFADDLAASAAAAARRAAGEGDPDVDREVDS